MISWEERLRLILAIVDKDRRIPVWMWITTFLIAFVGFFLLLRTGNATAQVTNEGHS